MNMKLKTMVSVLALSLALSGCQTFGEMNNNQASEIKTLIEKEEPDFLALFEKAKTQILAENWTSANRNLNKALRINFSNSSLQELNALSYHIQASRGASQHYSLAEQGYISAIRFDPSNWSARYFLGVLYLEQRKFMEAQRQFAAYVAENDQDAEALYYLVSASYFANDLETAGVAAERLWQVAGTVETGLDPHVLLQMMSMIKAAVNEDEEAASYLEEYLKAGGELGIAQRLSNRLESWRRNFAEIKKDNRLAAAETDNEISDQSFGIGQTPLDEPEDSSPFSTVSESENSGFGTFENSFGSYDPEPTSAFDADALLNDQMVAVDVVIIRSEEDLADAYGVNVLTGLQLQFGNPDTGASAWSRSTEVIKDRFDATLDQSNHILTNMISVPAVAYTMNIANAQSGRNEILARPTLVARAGQTSEFFSGVEVSAAAVSGGAGDSVSIEKEIGVKLMVTPQFAPDGTIFMNVRAERTFLTTPSSSVVFEFRLDTSKTNVNANVAMKFGQTLILSGLSERETERDADKVPVVGDVPLFGRLFNRETSRDFNKSVLILLTPRPVSYIGDEGGSAVGAEASTTSELIRNALAGRHPDWFQPNPTLRNIVKLLGKTELYRDFQSKDLPKLDWTKSESLSRRIQSIMSDAKA
ncbi:MAG: hypothetical protein JJ879_09820 [Sneathiella sp.]|nr:hypothetical protein [Sneathiella sp.]